MALVVVDTFFEKLSGNGLLAHIADKGGGWTLDTGAASNIPGLLRYVENSQVGTGNRFFLTTSIKSQNYDVGGDFTFLTTTNLQQVGLIANAPDTATRQAEFVYDIFAGAWQIYDGAVSSSLTEAAPASPFSMVFKLRSAASEGWTNGVQKCALSSRVNASTGVFVGLNISDFDSAQALAQVRATNYYVDDLVVPGDKFRMLSGPPLRKPWAEKFPVNRFIGKPFAVKTVGGTVYTQTLTATVGAAGTLPKQAAKPLLATTASAGTLAKRVQKAFTAAVAGAGTLASVKVLVRSFTATVAIAGTLAKQTQKPLTAAVAGAGTVVKLLSKAFTATVAIAGGLVKQSQKAFTATVGATGTLGASKAFLRVVTGAVAIAGTMVKQVNKPLAATVASNGALVRLVNRALTATVAGAGVLVKQTQRALTATVAGAGALVASKVLVRLFTGTVASVGTLSRQGNKVLLATVAGAGTIVRVVSKGLTATVAGAGVVLKQTQRAITGAVAITGTLAAVRVLVRTFTGAVASVGTLSRQGNKVLVGAVASVGTSIKLTIRALAAAVASVGGMVTQFFANGTYGTPGPEPGSLAFGSLVDGYTSSLSDVGGVATPTDPAGITSLADVGGVATPTDPAGTASFQ